MQRTTLSVLKNLVCLILCGGLLFPLASCNKAANDDEKLSGKITISGAYAMYPLVGTWSEEFQKLHPDVHIGLSTGGAGKGMIAVMSDIVDLAMVSRELYDSELELGAVPFACAKDGVVITINARNPFAKELMQQGISKETATKIWITGEYTTWGQVLGTDDKTPIHAYTRSDACGAAETFATWMGKKQADLVGTPKSKLRSFLYRIKMREKDPDGKTVTGDPGMIAVIKSDKLGIGYNNVAYAYDKKSHKPRRGMLVCPIDVNSDGTIDAEEYFYDTNDDFLTAVAEGKYPLPPARNLYLVSHGVPTNSIVVEFLKYVLTEGQKCNRPEGYMSLSEDEL